MGQTDNIFESSVGKAGQQERCKARYIEFLRQEIQEQFVTYVLVVEGSTRQKMCINEETVAKLASSIEECGSFVWAKNSVCPVEGFISTQNTIAEPGWL